MVLLARQILTWSLTGVLILFLPHHLGDQGLGQIAFATSFAGMFVSLILLGAPTYLVKEVARDRGKVDTLFLDALLMRLPPSAAVLALVMLSVQAMGYSSQARWVVFIVCLATLVTGLNSTAVSLLQGLEKMRWPSAAEVVAKAIVTGVGILLLSNGRGVIAYALVLLLGAGVNLAMNLSYFSFGLKLRPRLDLRVWRSLLVGGFPFLMVDLLTGAYQHVDTALLRFMTDEATVGWYAVALQLLGTLNFLPVAIATAVLPALSRMHSDSPDRMAVAARRSLKLLLALSLPMAAGTMLTSGKILELLRFPEVFQNSAAPMAILAISLPVQGFLIVAAAVVMAADRQRQWAVISALALAFNVALGLFAIPYAHLMFGNGAIGAAATLVASEMAALFMATRLLPRGVLDRSTLVVLGKSALGTGVMALAVWTVREADLAIVVLVGSLVYGTSSLLSGAIEPDELSQMRMAVANAVGDVRHTAQGAGHGS